MKITEQFLGFDWDEGNSDKNFLKYNVTSKECEEIFFNSPILLFRDEKHSSVEERFFVLGKTNKGRKLFLVFTRRGTLIRVISARDMSSKERNYYEKELKRNS